jgi:3-oxoadipate enol-lactonase
MPNMSGLQVLARPWGAMHIAAEGPADGPAVVFVNSLGTDLRLWDALLPRLPSGLRLLRFDKRGHGLSDAGGDYGIDDLAADVIALINEAQCGPVVLVGLSIGGLVAQALAAQRPDLLRGLVLSNTAAKIGTAQMWAARIAAIEAQGLGGIADGVMERWFTPAFRASPDIALWRNMLARTSRDGYLAACRAIAAADLAATTARIALPTLVIGGSHDGSTPPDMVEALARLVPGSRCHIIAGTGHLPCVEAPDAYAALLADSIKEIGHV